MSKTELSKELQSVFSETKLQRPEDSAGFHLWRAFTFYQRTVEAELKALGLTHLQFATLVTSAWLGRLGGEVSQRDISRLSGIQEAQLSLMIGALAKKKLIAQSASEVDSRRRSISLTRKGVAALRAAILIMNEVQSALWKTRKSEVDFSKLLSETLREWGAI